MTLFDRKYATAAGADVYLPMTKAGVVDFAVGADWTPAAGDVTVSKDGGVETNITTLPVYTNGSWKFVFSDAELTAKRITVRIVDSATKAVEDNQFAIETYGDASAMKVFDYSVAAPTAAQIVDAVFEEARADHEAAGSFGEGFNRMHAAARNKKRANKATGATKVFKDDGTTVLFTQTLAAGPSDDEVDLNPS